MSAQTSARRDVCGVRTGPKVPRAQIELRSFNVACASAALRDLFKTLRGEKCARACAENNHLLTRQQILWVLFTRQQLTSSTWPAVMVSLRTVELFINLFQVCCHRGLFIFINMFIFLPSAESNTPSFSCAGRKTLSFLLSECERGKQTNNVFSCARTFCT